MVAPIVFVFRSPVRMGLTDEQSWWLYLLGGLVCVHASLTAITLLNRASLKQGSTRALWVLINGVTSGCGIWAAHLIVTLPLASDYNIVLALLSLLTVVTVTTLGFSIAVYWPARWNAPIGGALVGGGFAGMTCLGMAALRPPDQVTWYLDFVVAAVALAIVFATASLAVAVRGDSSRITITAGTLLVFALIANQALMMGALNLVADPSNVAGTLSLSPSSFVLLIACASAALLEMSLVGTFVDRRSEALLREQSRRLDTALNNMSQGLLLFDSSGRLLMCNDRYRQMYGLSAEVLNPGCTLEELFEYQHITESGFRDADHNRTELTTILASGKSSENVVELTDGHSTGAALLVEVSAKLRTACGNAFLARLGGDEFTLVLADGQQPAAAEMLAERLKTALGDEVELGGHQLRISLSIGVAIFPVDGSDGNTLLA